MIDLHSVQNFIMVDWYPKNCKITAGAPALIPKQKDAGLMKEKFRQFMIGRYGTDGLNQFLSMASIVLLLLSLLTRFSLFTWLGLALLILCYYRSLSRNISKRTEENYQSYTLKDRIDRRFRSLKDQWANRKIYHYYRCPKCRQKLRVPRGRGRIQISCPRCGTQFIKKS